MLCHEHELNARLRALVCRHHACRHVTTTNNNNKKKKKKSRRYDGMGCLPQSSRLVDILEYRMYHASLYNAATPD